MQAKTNVLMGTGSAMFALDVSSLCQQPHSARGFVFRRGFTLVGSEGGHVDKHGGCHGDTAGCGRGLISKMTIAELILRSKNNG